VAVGAPLREGGAPVALPLREGGGERVSLSAPLSEGRALIEAAWLGVPLGEMVPPPPPPRAAEALPAAVAEPRAPEGVPTAVAEPPPPPSGCARSSRAAAHVKSSTADCPTTLTPTQQASE
jgi:hypothetical protein